MRIELKDPYAAMYRRAYLRRDSRGRGRVDLINTKFDRTTISYARYLLEVEMGRRIPAGYEVDHIDADCSNDDLGNLQILTTEEHLRKSAAEREGISYKSLVCPQCGLGFERETRQLTLGKKNIFCSRSCNARFSISVAKTAKVANPITVDKIREIQSLALEGLSGYRIKKITGISGNTVLKYIKELASVPECSSKA